MELDELHVLDLGPCTPGKGYAVASCGVGVARIEIHLAASAGRKNGVRRTYGEYLLRLGIKHIGPDALTGSLLHPEPARGGEQIYDRGMLEYLDIGLAANRADHGGFALLARDVTGMENSPCAVAALAREIP